MWASLSTFEPRYSTGKNAPHKNAEPSATTFTIPPIASLFFTNVLIRSAKVKADNENTNEFNMYNKPLVLSTEPFSKIIASNVYKSHKTNT